MTNSFQPQARPVDTFVSPSTVAPTTDLDRLTRALQIVNPGINKFIDFKLDGEIKKEQAIGVNQEIQKSLNDGTFGKLATNIQKKDGVDAAKELIGGSIFRRKAAERTKAKLAVLGLKSTFETEYTNPFDTGEVDADGSPILKSISEFAPDSQEWSTWTQNILNRAFTSLEGVSPEIIAEHFTPDMGDQVFNITSHHIKEHKQFQFEDYIAETPNIIQKGTNLAITGKPEDLDQLKGTFNEHFQGLYKLGVTGPLAKKLYRDTLDIPFAQSDILLDQSITTNNPALREKARLLPEMILENIPYGPGGTKNLTEHPDFEEKLADHVLKFNSKAVQIYKANEELEELEGEQELQDLVKRIDAIKITDEEGNINLEKAKEAQELFQAFLDEPKNVDLFEEAQKIGRMDNQRLLTDIAPLIRKQIREGFYGDDIDKALTDINMAKAKHPTLDREAIQIFNGLTEYAKQAPKIGPMLSTMKDEIMRPVNKFLGINIYGPLEAPGNYRKATRYDNTVEASLAQWIEGYIEENKKIPSEAEQRKKVRQYKDQIQVNLKILRKDDIDKKYPIDEFDNPFENTDNFSGKEIEETSAGNRRTGQGNRGYRFTDETNQFAESGELGDEAPPEDQTPPEDEKPTEVTGEKSLLDALIGNYYKPQIINVSTLEALLENNIITSSKGGRFVDKKGNYYQLEKGALMPSMMTDTSESEYEVKAGDTLSQLADQFKTTIGEIMEANNITDEDFINIGQKLMMPINTIGDALVPESDKTNPSVLDEIDITQPFEYNSLYRLAQEVGFNPEQARIMAAIALAESSGRAAIDTVQSGLDPEKKNEFSLGLWQINMEERYEAQRLKDFRIKNKQELYNPAVNARAAKILYEQQGFGAWTKYLNGEYKKFLPKN
jgi:hypothetical protein|tara:strand:+ start:1445 stop:4123 length:2679 start_codon:yes stop_codon:yes gene_type:complete